MEWEPWVIGAQSYQEFKQKAQKIGFSNIPLAPNPMMGFEKMLIDGTTAKIDKLPNQKTMLRKKID